MKYPTGNQAWDDWLFDSDVSPNEKKPLLNKIINIGTNYLDFREGQDG